MIKKERKNGRVWKKMVKESERKRTMADCLSSQSNCSGLSYDSTEKKRERVAERKE